MAEIVDKGLLILIGVILASRSDMTAAPVIAMLIGVIAAALGICVTDHRGRSIYMITFLLGCFVLPELVYFLPVLFYDCVTERRLWILFGMVPVFTIYYSAVTQMGYQVFGIWITVLVTGVALGYRTERLEYLESEIIRLRDTSTELNLELREENKRLMEKQDYEIYLATLRERNRIAREIHDNVGHMLSRSILQVGALKTVYKEEPIHGQLGSVNETLNQAMNSIRESVHDLHDNAIDLRNAVTEAIRTVDENYQVTIDYDMTPEVPRNVKYCFIMTVKEAMSNIVKHSDADRVMVVLREHPGFYQLTVEDNGGVKDNRKTVMWENSDWKGSPGDEGIGLINMRERVVALNGTIRIYWEKGFRIYISIPKDRAGFQR